MDAEEDERKQNLSTKEDSAREATPLKAYMNAYYRNGYGRNSSMREDAVQTKTYLRDYSVGGLQRNSFAEEESTIEYQVQRKSISWEDSTGEFQRKPNLKEEATGEVQIKSILKDSSRSETQRKATTKDISAEGIPIKPYLKDCSTYGTEEEKNKDNDEVEEIIEEEVINELQIKVVEKDIKTVGHDKKLDLKQDYTSQSYRKSSFREESGIGGPVKSYLKDYSTIGIRRISPKGYSGDAQKKLNLKKSTALMDLTCIPKLDLESMLRNEFENDKRQGREETPTSSYTESPRSVVKKRRRNRRKHIEATTSYSEDYESSDTMTSNDRHRRRIRRRRYREKPRRYMEPIYYLPHPPTHLPPGVMRPQSAGMPAQHPTGIPPQTPGMTPKPHGMPLQPHSIPSQHSGIHPQHPGMPPQTLGMSPQTPGMPPQTPGMPSQYPGMPPQHHIFLPEPFYYCAPPNMEPIAFNQVLNSEGQAIITAAKQVTTTAMQTEGEDDIVEVKVDKGKIAEHGYYSEDEDHKKEKEGEDRNEKEKEEMKNEDESDDSDKPFKPALCWGTSSSEDSNSSNTDQDGDDGEHQNKRVEKSETFTLESHNKRGNIISISSMNNHQASQQEANKGDCNTNMAGSTSRNQRHQNNKLPENILTLVDMFNTLHVNNLKKIIEYSHQGNYRNWSTKRESLPWETYNEAIPSQKMKGKNKMKKSPLYDVLGNPTNSSRGKKKRKRKKNNLQPSRSMIDVVYPSSNRMPVTGRKYNKKNKCFAVGDTLAIKDQRYGIERKLTLKEMKESQSRRTINSIIKRVGAPSPLRQTIRSHELLQLLKKCDFPTNISLNQANNILKVWNKGKQLNTDEFMCAVQTPDYYLDTLKREKQLNQEMEFYKNWKKISPSPPQTKPKKSKKKQAAGNLSQVGINNKHRRLRIPNTDVYLEEPSVNDDMEAYDNFARNCVNKNEEIINQVSSIDTITSTTIKTMNNTMFNKNINLGNKRVLRRPSENVECNQVKVRARQQEYSNARFKIVRDVKQDTNSQIKNWLKKQALKAHENFSKKSPYSYNCMLKPNKSMKNLQASYPDVSFPKGHKFKNI